MHVLWSTSIQVFKLFEMKAFEKFVWVAKIMIYVIRNNHESHNEGVTFDSLELCKMIFTILLLFT